MGQPAKACIVTLSSAPAEPVAVVTVTRSVRVARAGKVTVTSPVELVSAGTVTVEPSENWMTAPVTPPKDDVGSRNTTRPT